MKLEAMINPNLSLYFKVPPLRYKIEKEKNTVAN